MTPTLKKHLAAIQSGLVTKSNIIGIRKAINTDARLRHGYSTGVTSPKVDANDAIEIERAIGEFRPFVDDALKASGLRVLQDRRYRKRWNAAQAKVIENIKSFRLVNFWGIDGAHIVPIYEAISHFGSFQFFVIPWQTAYALGELSGPQLVPWWRN